MTRRLWPAPALVLVVGGVLLQGVKTQHALPLRGDLGSVLSTFDDYTPHDMPIPEAEQRVAGMDTYLLRVFTRDSTDLFSLYVGYYESQQQGTSIHSPKNCLPGGGWEPVSAGTETIMAGGDKITVNRYLIAKGPVRALVYYWYQGRGRVAWNEYAVKWDLLRDKALLRRSDEALVRIVVPINPARPEAAESLATKVASAIVEPLTQVLPAGPARP